MKALVVPTDFSSGALDAAKYAAGMAMQMKAEIYLLHVIDMHSPANRKSMEDETYNEKLLVAENELKKLENEIGSITAKPSMIHTVIEKGSFREKLVQFCDKKAPFAVVMGIGKKASEIFEFGSNTLHAVKHVRYPIVVIPAGKQFSGINRILFAYDFDDFNRSVPGEEIRALCNAFGAHIDLLHVQAKKKISLATNAEVHYLKDITDDRELKFHSIKAVSVEDGINSFIKTHPVDMIIMLPKHHSFFAFHKSHTESVALTSSVPLMTIHE